MCSPHALDCDAREARYCLACRTGADVTHHPSCGRQEGDE